MASQTTPPPIQSYDISNFRFRDGTVLPSARIAYLDINSSATKVALIPTCFKGTLHSTLNFVRGALRDHRVIVAAQFGNGESSSPSNTPSAAFPASLDYRDTVAAQHALLTQHLGIAGPIDIVIGFSMAGQCTYYWTALYPSLVKRAVMICSSARTSGHNRQFLEGPATALESAVDYVGVSVAEDQVKKLDSPKGVRAFAKAYSAWLTSAEWYDQEKWRELGYGSLKDYDEDATGPRYKGSYPDDLLAMLRCWQAGDVGVCFGGGDGGDAGADVALAQDRMPLADVLGRIETPVLLMPCSTDQYFRWEASEREAKMLRNARLEVVPSVWGHLAGAGADREAAAWMDDKIAKFLQDA